MESKPMKQALENLIKSNNNGLFLLDPPTGFGKTTSVLEIIKDFLSGSPLYSKVKKIFFVTNLKTNLPVSTLLAELGEEEKKKCFQAKATIDYILERFSNAKIDNNEITSSKEYKNLKKDIEAYQSIQASLEKDENNYGLRNSLTALKDKISLDTERKFRDFIKSNFLSNKSIAYKNKFIDGNGWLKYLYPICDLEKYKVIFLTTKKFISPIDTFRRLPFYAYNDEITKDSIVFIDEFDSTKDTLLQQIVKDGLKNKTDLISLFLDIHFALDNIVLPKELLRTSEYHKKKVESGEWHDSEWHYKHWGEEFAKVYDKHKLKYLLKSVDFADGRAFLYDDGKYFNVFKDNSKKFIYVELDKNSDSLSLRAKEYTQESMPINQVLRDVEYCIDGFIEALFYTYKKDRNHNIIDLRLSPNNNMEYISEDACELPIILSIAHIKEYFEKNGYATSFKKAHYIMTPSLFQQVYLGALGEIVGKFILESELGFDLENLECGFYEFFDYKIGNNYFDFKHWDNFIKDNDEYVKKIEWKLSTVKGAKCFVINLLKRTDSPAKINIGETVIQIPYLFDADTGELNFEAINYIRDLL